MLIKDWEYDNQVFDYAQPDGRNVTLSVVEVLTIDIRLFYLITTFPIPITLSEVYTL